MYWNGKGNIKIGKTIAKEKKIKDFSKHMITTLERELTGYRGIYGAA